MPSQFGDRVAPRGPSASVERAFNLAVDLDRLEKEYDLQTRI
jgi:hypothetical protein